MPESFEKYFSKLSSQSRLDLLHLTWVILAQVIPGGTIEEVLHAEMGGGMGWGEARPIEP
jgi:hypothetical protein